MKCIFLLTIFIASHVHAVPQCFLYEVKGAVRLKDTDMHIVVNEGTMSELKLEVKTLDAGRFGSFLDSTTTGLYVFQGKPVSKSVIQQVKSVARSTPDPINHKNHSYIKELKAVKCPK